MSEQIINADTLPPSKGLFQERWAILKRNSMAYASFWFLIALFAFAIMGKVLTQNIVVFDPKTVRLSEKFLPPLTPYTSKISAKEDAPVMGVYLLGTDELGRDVFARMMEGSFVSLTVGFVAVGISLTVGIFFGGLAGFYGRVKLGFITVDTLIMRFVDIMLCFPSFFFDSDCGCIVATKYLQHHDRDWLDQLDGNSQICSSRVFVSQGSGFCCRC